MKFRTLLGSVLGLEISLLGMAAQASYVVEAEPMGAGPSAIATGAAFDFVARDFGMEPGDAMRITLRNLASASNLRGNLLLWSLAPPPDSTSPDALADAGSPAAALVAAGPVTPGSGEDFSHYDDGDDSIETVSAATEAGAVGGAYAGNRVENNMDKTQVYRMLL